MGVYSDRPILGRRDIPNTPLTPTFPQGRRWGVPEYPSMLLKRRFP
jgi:hypothetical protein